MRRFIGTLGLVGCAAALLVGSAGTATAAPTTSGAACTGTVQIVSLTATPASILPGQSTDANLLIQNCTTRPQPVSVTWFGLYSQAGSGTFPGGCAAIDPLVYSATVPASGQYTSSFGLRVFSGCTATDLRITARLGNGTGTVASQTVDIPIGTG